MTDSGYLQALDILAHPHEVVHSVALRQVLTKLVKEHEKSIDALASSQEAVKALGEMLDDTATAFSDVCEERTELLRRVNKKWWLKWL